MNGFYFNSMKLKNLILASLSIQHLQKITRTEMERKTQMLSNIHGPAITVYGHSVRLKDEFGGLTPFNIPNNILQIDFTISLPCKWHNVSDWLMRANRKWPSHQVVEAIIEKGIHLVPKSQEDDQSGDTWRMSFSLAEMELSKHVPRTARR